MALTDESNGTNTTMLVQPTGFGGGNGFMDGGFGGWWIILLLLCLGNGMWGGFGGGMFGGMDGFGLYPWLNNSQNISGGFRDQMLNTQLSGIQNSLTSGFGDVQTALCGGFAGVNATVNGAQNALAQQLYSNQIADLERSFAAQTANTAGLTALQSQLATCCCENRAATADLKYTLASEACADRAAVQTMGQAILDKLCQQELDAERRDNANLRSQVNMLQIAAATNAQTAAIEASQAAQTQYIVNRVAPYPVPSYTVGNPYTSANTCSCGGYGIAA